MYDFKLNKDEETRLISDNTIVYTKNKERNMTCIITNQRLLILDYPSGVHNSAEDLRISGKMTYIKKKEVIGGIDLKDIETIIKETDYYRIELKNKEYINLNDDDIIEYLNNL
jgi:hypothetical protein